MIFINNYCSFTYKQKQLEKDTGLQVEKYRGIKLHRLKDNKVENKSK